MNKFLVTGAAGFIGSHLSEALLSEYPESSIVCLDNFDAFYDRNIKEKNIEYLISTGRFVMVEGDIRDVILLEQLFTDHRFDMVFHIAAKAGVRPSIQSPVEYHDVNIIGTQNILDAMVKYNVKKMVFASSSSVYGGNTKVPFSEQDPVNIPISPYAATKRAGELICAVAHHLYGLEIACVRFFTVYGPRQRPEMAIHKFTRMIDQGQKLPAFGNGSSERDYTYIDDIIHGLINISKVSFGFEIINLGESETTKLKELIEIIALNLEKEAKVDWQPSQPGDVDRTFADIGFAVNNFNYRPKVKIHTGVKKFVDWYKSGNTKK